MSKYYSSKLSQTVIEGRRETALQGKHIGGVPPLGYDLDRSTRQLVINPHEAEAVQMIFNMYLNGCGYTEIITELNRNGYKTKRQQEFRENSLIEVLRNEKYTGTYVYNKSASKSEKGTYNRYAYKDDSEIIRVANAVPVIIPRETFDKAQEYRASQRHKAARHTAKQNYVLTGKVNCGVRDSTYVGNARHPKKDHPMYVSYRCARRNDAVTCKNPEIKKETIEAAVLQHLSEALFDERMIPELMARYDKYASNKEPNIKTATKEQFEKAFYAARTQFEKGELPNQRRIMDAYFKKAVVFPNEIRLYFHPLPNVQL